MCYCGDSCYSCRNCSNCSDCPQLVIQKKRESNAKEVNEQLQKYRTLYKSANEELEKSLIENATKPINSFLDNIEPLNRKSFGGKSLNINIELIRQKQETMADKVIGHIGRVFDTKLVATNKEVSVIIQETDDAKRNRAFDDYCAKVHKEAILSLKDAVKDALEEQKKIVKQQILGRLEEVKVSFEKSVAEYQKLLIFDEHDSKKLEEVKLDYMYKMAIYNILISQLMNAKVG